MSRSALVRLAALVLSVVIAVATLAYPPIGILVGLIAVAYAVLMLQGRRADETLERK